MSTYLAKDRKNNKPNRSMDGRQAPPGLLPYSSDPKSRMLR